MRAAILKELGKPLIVEDVAVPVPGPGEVLVATRTCGLCGTDLHLCDGLAYVPSLPHIPGHEPAGVVEAVGEGVTQFAPGQRVVPHLFVTCGQCEYCRAGVDAQCTGLKGILGVLGPGALADFFTIPAENLCVLPDAIPFAEGGLIADAVLTALHAVRRSRVRLGETAVVIGAGGVGQCLIQILRAAGVRVAAIDCSPDKRRIALDLGADVAWALGIAEGLQSIKALSGGEGAHVVFECVGSTETLAEAAALARRGGRIIVIGEEPEYPPFDTITIAQRELEILGSRNGTRQDLRDAVDLVARGVVVPRIDRVFPLEAINDALDYFRSGSNGRVVIKIRED
jgi:propanol-preferring alcohol dehydrogenase